MNYKVKISDVLTYIFITILFIIVVITVYFTLSEYRSVFNGSYSTSHDSWGTFGDYLGGVLGSLLSFVAVILLFMTYLLQKKELSETSSALQEQSIYNNIRISKDTVFKLLERKDYVVESFEYKDVTGREGLDKLNNELSNLIKRYKNSPDEKFRKEQWSLCTSKLKYFRPIRRIIIGLSSYLYYLPDDIEIYRYEKLSLYNITAASFYEEEKMILRHLVTIIEMSREITEVKDLSREEYKVLKKLDRESFWMDTLSYSHKWKSYS